MRTTRECAVIRFPFLLLFSLNAFAVDIQLNWEAPTQYEDGSALTKIDRYNIYYTVDNVLQDVIEVSATATDYTLVDVAQGTYVFQISTVSNGNEGKVSTPAVVNVDDKKPIKIELTVRVID